MMASREVTRRLLEPAGYTVLAVSSPEAARRTWNEHHGDIALVITDVVMPEGSGHDLAAFLQAQRPGLPVLFITGYDPSSSDDVAHGPTLPKPFTREELLSAVGESIERP